MRKFDINSLYTCPPHLYTVATLPWEIQKVIFQQYYSFILPISYVISEKNKLLLSYPLHLKNVAPQPCKNCTNSLSFHSSRVSSTNSLYGSTSCGTAASCCDMAGFQHSIVDDTVDQWQKRLEGCIRAEGGYFEHLL